MKRTCKAVVGVVAVAAALSAGPANAQDLTWEVINPFRFYKDASAFKLHEDAFKVVTGNPGTADKAQFIRNIERCLNDPNTADPAIRDACKTVVREHRADLRLGWAASTLDATCYDYKKARIYPAKCDREHGGRRVAEDYVLPELHAVSIGLSPARVVEAGTARCTWSWKPRAGGEWLASNPQPCTERRSIDVPYAADRASSGLDVKVEVAGRDTFSESVVVEDLLITALGDLFASGEGNPDRPVTFSASRAMNYNPPRCDVATATMGATGKSVFRTKKRVLEGNNYILPRRLMKDELRGDGTRYDDCSREFAPAFWEASAKWLSPDCHRSQYAFPIRVSLQVALENRQRAVTLIQLACSGAFVNRGLFDSLNARVHHDPLRKKVTSVEAQFDQLTRLLCSVPATPSSEPYPMKVFKSGDIQLQDTVLRMRWCPPDKRKRDIDLVLLSIGGNDIGFGPLAAYTFLDRMADIAPVAFAIEKTERFGPNLAEAYLTTLDGRMEAVRKALKTGFGVDSSKVIQASYENAEFDEEGKLCGGPASATMGMDVHNRFGFNADRVKEVNRFLGKLFSRLQCVTSAQTGCPTDLKTGEGTKFTLVVEHQPEFLRRGMCARNPALPAEVEQTSMPRIPLGQAGGFSPYLPSSYRPYAHRTRLFRTPNDAFMTANEHRGGGGGGGSETPAIDILQPAVAALLSGAFHPTAEAHAIVADHVMTAARRVLEQRPAGR